jgi:hypothetical protein
MPKLTLTLTSTSTSTLTGNATSTATLTSNSTANSTSTSTLTATLTANSTSTLTSTANSTSTLTSELKVKFDSDSLQSDHLTYCDVCKVWLLYGTIIKRDGDYPALDSYEMVHCVHCHRKWDGNAQCPCHTDN